MFTGLVEAKNTLLAHAEIEGGKRLTFGHHFEHLELGESIAMNGACLTVVSFDDDRFDVELSLETLRLTTLGRLDVGDEVNMERALVAGARLGGHMVSGHVDGVARVTGKEPEGEMTKLSLDLPVALSRFVAKKGSLTVDGVSLTVNAVVGNRADLLLIPHTQSVTTLGRLSIGDEVNIEVDLIARYVERLLEARQD